MSSKYGRMSYKELNEELFQCESSLQYHLKKKDSYKGHLQSCPDSQKLNNQFNYHSRKASGYGEKKRWILIYMKSLVAKIKTELKRQKGIRNEIISIHNERYQSIVSDKYDEIRRTN